MMILRTLKTIDPLQDSPLPFDAVIASEEVLLSNSRLTFSFFFSIFSRKSSNLESVSSSSDTFDFFVGGKARWNSRDLLVGAGPDEKLWAVVENSYVIENNSFKALTSRHIAPLWGLLSNHHRNGDDRDPRPL